MRILSNICRWIDTFNEWVGKGVSWVTLLLVVVVFVDVVMRYAFRTSFVFVQELEWHLFSFIFIIGAGCTLLRDGHVRVDIFYQGMGEKSKAWVNLIGVIFFRIRHRSGFYGPCICVSYACVRGADTDSCHSGK